ncbi:MAG TPA: hypothetical protein ENK89_07455, partial [Desulfobulbaceae bacterium]|nr:hypothetical protein [Desulfobulbaceae bacterium]
MKKINFLINFTCCLILFLILAGTARSARIKDLAAIEGVRENQLLGYGLVMGLNGTGDDIKKSVFTRQALINLVKRLGMSITPEIG